jgi:hypothetical protein
LPHALPFWIPAFAGMTWCASGLWRVRWDDVGHPLRARFACTRPLTLREGDGLGGFETLPLQVGGKISVQAPLNFLVQGERNEVADNV